MNQTDGEMKVTGTVELVVSEGELHELERAFLESRPVAGKFILKSFAPVGIRGGYRITARVEYGRAGVVRELQYA